MKPSAERIARVAALKRTLFFPLSDEEKIKMASEIAAVRAEDERRRAPVLQLELRQAA